MHVSYGGIRFDLVARHPLKARAPELHQPEGPCVAHVHCAVHADPSLAGSEARHTIAHSRLRTANVDARWSCLGPRRFAVAARTASTTVDDLLDVVLTGVAEQTEGLILRAAATACPGGVLAIVAPEDVASRIALHRHDRRWWAWPLDGACAPGPLRAVLRVENATDEAPAILRSDFANIIGDALLAPDEHKALAQARSLVEETYVGKVRTSPEVPLEDLLTRLPSR